MQFPKFPPEQESIDTGERRPIEPAKTDEQICYPPSLTLKSKTIARSRVGDDVGKIAKGKFLKHTKTKRKKIYLRVKAEVE